MYGTDDLLISYEECPRKSWWMKDWTPWKMTTVEMMQVGVKAGLTEKVRTDWGEVAGEAVYGLGAEHGLLSKQHDIHAEIVHLACIADIAVSAIRKGDSWKEIEPIELDEYTDWSTDIFVDPTGLYLRRVVFVTSWSDDRHYSLCRSWKSLGNVCMYSMPMQMVVVNLGTHKDGKYYSPWSRGYRHPANKSLRFRKRNDVSQPFKHTWQQIWREDYDDISTSSWLQSMLTDKVLEEYLFVVDIPAPSKETQTMIRDLAKKKLYKIEKTRDLPDMQLTGCNWPTKCQFINPCHGGAPPSRKYGFVPVEELATTPSV